MRLALRSEARSQARRRFSGRSPSLAPWLFAGPSPGESGSADTRIEAERPSIRLPLGLLWPCVRQRTGCSTEHGVGQLRSRVDVELAEYMSQVHLNGFRGA